MNRRSFLLPSLVLGLGLGLVACSGESIADPGTPAPTDVTNVPEARSEKSRDTKPNVGPTDMQALTRDARDFATGMYAELRKGQAGKNVFFSPHSIYAAFGMLYAGAQGSTESAMTKGLSVSLPQARFHAGMNALDLELESRAAAAANAGATGADGKGFRLAIANSAWSQAGFKFEAPYLDTLAVNYGAGLSLLDFARDSDGASRTINAWIEKKTEGRIKDLVSGLPSDTKLVLANAVYFNAAWQQTFSESATHDDSWTGLDGAKTVKMMQTTSYGSYVSNAVYDAVALPYEGGKVEFVAIAPKGGTFNEYESSFNRVGFDAVIGDLVRGQVNVTMPRFEIKGDVISLKPALAAMGMGEMFSDNANFRGVTAAECFHVFDAVHKAFVKVDERGTEAAAATAIIAGTSSAGPEPKVIRLERPFLFAIRDVPTGAILFLGRMLTP